jgi:hypothetical protein
MPFEEMTKGAKGNKMAPNIKTICFEFLNTSKQAQASKQANNNNNTRTDNLFIISVSVVVAA